MIEQTKFYIKGIINGILLSTWFWEFLDEGVKVISVSLGAVLTFFLIRKAIADEKLTQEKRRGEKLNNDMLEQKIIRARQQNGQL
jgi:hypothetical protein